MEMEIKILGANCSKCNTLFERTQHVVNQHQINAKVLKIESVAELAQFNVFVVPAIIINNEVVSKGVVLSEIEILRLINKYLPMNEQIDVPVQKKSTSGKWFFLIIVLAIIAISTVLLINHFSKSPETVVKKEPLTLPDSLNQMYNYSANKLEYKLTFLEFGSTNCIPCKKMEAVMDEIENKYQGVVNTVFYNVTQKQNDAMATYFNIEIIPAQVLLDNKGHEFFRHIGYFPTDSLSMVIDEQLKNKQ